jgi:hypothetical protein
MIELLKSFSSMSLALALLPIRQIEKSLAPGGPPVTGEAAMKTMDAITIVTVENFGERLRNAFLTVDDAQRRAITTGAKMLWPFGSEESLAGDGRPANAEQSQTWESQRKSEQMDVHSHW